MRANIPRSITVALMLVISLRAAAGRPASAQDCPALADLRIQDTNMLSTVIVEASDELPEYCRVLGYVRPAINFEIRLPTTEWNGKFYMAGCGGFCGRIDADQGGFFNSGTYGLKRNYAVSKMDGGHWGHWQDGRWAYHNRQAEIDFGYRAVHETARVTKEIINAYYGTAPEYSYFQGCSGGGRQGMMEAQRFPDDFDGVLAGAPAYRQTGLMTYFTNVAHANKGADGRNVLTRASLDLIGNEVYAACDASDGLTDGLLNDPRSCTFDFTKLLCEDGQTDACLTAEQVASAQAIYAPPVNSTGKKLFAGGAPLGSEKSWAWSHFETPNPDDGGFPGMAEQSMRYVAFRDDPGEAIHLEDFDFDSDPERMEFMAGIYDADDPDLDEFADRGGKVLIWHGWTDVAVPPEESIAYYEAVNARAGADDVSEYLRLFMIPGMDHCGITNGPGIDQHGFDPLTALERWVEQDEPPTSLLMTKSDSTGAVEWTRPACPYPQRAVYDGEGAVRDASSFRCEAP